MQVLEVLKVVCEWFKHIVHVDTLLGNDHEVSSYTTAVAI